jgi:alpha-tubulin suppressor-like RCC1 family protein
MHTLWGGVRPHSRAVAVGAVIALVLSGVTMLDPAPPAGASTPPTVSAFTAKPSSLTWAGGTVTLSLKVANAKTCTFSVTPAIKGLPAKQLCNGTVNQKVTVPKNTGKKVITFAFDVTATGTTTVKAPAIRLSESDVLPGPPTAASASPENTSAAVSFVRPSTAGSSTITQYTVTATDTTTSAHGGQKQSGTASPITVTGLTNGDNYTFAVAATNASGTGPSSAGSEGVTPSLPLAGVVSDASDGFGDCAVILGGGVDCWGAGALGNGTTGSSDIAQPVPDISGAVSITSASQDIGGYCAVLSTGGVECWGDNSFGELGDGTTVSADAPQAVTGITTAVSVASVSSVNLAASYCAVLSTGGVECWGDNSDGQLGNGTTGGPDCNGSCYDTPQAVTGITDAVSLTSDADGEDCAVLSTGGVECWGDNIWGQLGNGTTGGPDGVSPFAGYDTPQAVTGITDAISIASEVGSSNCVVLSTGGVVCWGANSGQLGNGTVGGPDGENGYDTPQAVTGITDALSVTSDADGEYCAVLSTGAVDCWGYNGDGELGIGTISGPDGEDGYDTPQAVTGITDAVSVSSYDVATELDDFGYCAVLSTGKLDCWGGNSTGELGNGTIGGPDHEVGYDTPQAVTGITNAAVATADASGYFGNCAVLTTGGMDCWGYNGDDELGTGSVGVPNGSDDTPQAVRSL